LSHSVFLYKANAGEENGKGEKERGEMKKGGTGVRKAAEGGKANDVPGGNKKIEKGGKKNQQNRGKTQKNDKKKQCWEGQHAGTKARNCPSLSVNEKGRKGRKLLPNKRLDE